MRYRPWCFPAGIFAAAFLPALPDRSVLVVTAIAACALFLYSRKPRFPLSGSGLAIAALLALGFVYGCLWGQARLASQLPRAFDKCDVSVIGVISDLPDSNGLRTRMELAVESIVAADGVSLPPLKKLRISWYNGEPVRAGQRWRFSLRLRSPRGFSNPGGFDYEGWLFSRGISATGYVRNNGAALIDAAPRRTLTGYRQELRDTIQALTLPDRAKGMLAALVLGDSSLIPPALFQRLVDTGTVHLMVVSGLHIGLVSGLCFGLGMLLGRLLSALGAPFPARFTAVALAIPGTFAYAALAGFGLPVQRALIMSLAVLLALVFRRRVRPGRVFVWALTGVALIDPLAVIRQGFWLSFTAVAGLLAWFLPRPGNAGWRRLLWAQGVVFVCLAPLLIYFQGRASPLALPVNLIAIPWIGTGVVPAALAGAALHDVPVLGEFLWWLSGTQLQWFAVLLDSLGETGSGDGLPGSWLRSGDPWLLAAGGLVAVALLMPRGLGLVPMASVLVVAVAVSRAPAPPVLRVSVLDVGQGLAVVIEAADRTLVYDAGPRFSDAFDTGSAAVAPYLRHLGVQRLDKLMVSHGDSDHAGGVAGLLELVPAGEIIAAQPGSLGETQATICTRGRSWRWGEINFRVVWPTAASDGAAPASTGGDNNRSCVLVVESGDARILLPGDIEADVERQLLDSGLIQGPFDLIVAPHHGSKSSSSRPFVNQLQPANVVFSAGFNHHFGHPHEDVVARYQRAGARLWWTARSGAVIFSWHLPGREISVAENRSDHRRYWHSNPWAGASVERRGEGHMW